MKSVTEVGQALRAPLLSTGNGGERSETEWTVDNNGAASKNRPALPDPEVPAKATRRRFSKEYKLAVVEEADRCNEMGEIGALLRREGLYSSHLRNWRRERRQGTLAAMNAMKRGPKPKTDGRDERIGRLERENKRLQAQLRQAEAIINIQEKVSEILGIPLPETDGIDS
jgi:transposase-like protein